MKKYLLQVFPGVFIPKFACMSLKRKDFIFFAVYLNLIALILTLPSCSNNAPEKPQNTGRGVVGYTDKSSGTRINESLRYLNDTKRTPPKEIEEKIESQFLGVANNGVLSLGTSLNGPHAWLYVELNNSEQDPRNLTLATAHIRCDRLEVFRLLDEETPLISDISRATKASERPYLSQEFAFPLRLEANETARILMRTTRHLGAMEVDFRLYEERHFLETLHRSRLWDIFNLSFVLVITVLSLIVGLGYSNPLMAYFGIFSLCTLLVYSYILNFWDGFELPAFSNLRNHNLGSFLALVQGVLFHPFGKQILVSYGIHIPFYRKTANVLMLLNATMALALLLPAPWVGVLFVRSYTLLTLCNIACMLFITGIIYRRTGQKWLLVTCILIIAPVLVRLPSGLLYFSDRFYATITAPNIPLITALLAYFTAKQLLLKLTSKAELERRLVRIKMDMSEMSKEETQKIGRNLHDQLGNTLASALGYLHMKVPDIAQTQILLKQAIQELRFTSHNLVKDDDLPLTTKIATITDRFNDFSSIHFRFYDYSGGKVDQLDPVRQQNLYLIIQELLTNAVRYSQAREMVIQAFEYETSVQFSIEEDGVGFDISQSRSGLGLRNIYKRAELARLNVTIDSSPGKGTSVIILADL